MATRRNPSKQKSKKRSKIYDRTLAMFAPDRYTDVRRGRRTTAPPPPKYKSKKKNPSAADMARAAKSAITGQWKTVKIRKSSSGKIQIKVPIRKTAPRKRATKRRK